jgi:hypothetical protein
VETGHRRPGLGPSTTAEAIALVIDSARDVPAIAEFGVY